MMGWVAGLTATIAAAMIAVAGAHAADVPPPPPGPALKTAADWTVTIGVEGRVLPRFIGSDSYLFVPVPIVDVRRAGTPLPFRSPRDGFGFAILDTGRFQAGPVAQVELGRRHRRNNPEWVGLPNVGLTVEVGGFVNFWVTDWLRAHGELRQGIGGHHGIIFEQALDVVVPLTPQWRLSGGPRLAIATADANRPYFGVDAAASMTSGLPVFDPKGGVRAVGAGAQLRYQWNAQWATHVYYEYDRLVGDPGQAPVVTVRGSPNQNMFGFGATYSFDMNTPW